MQKMTEQRLLENASRFERQAAGSDESSLAEELELLERSAPSKAAVLGSAIDAVVSAMASAYPDVDKSKLSGIVTHHMGRAMKEARALSK